MNVGYLSPINGEITYEVIERVVTPILSSRDYRITKLMNQMRMVSNSYECNFNKVGMR